MALNNTGTKAGRGGDAIQSSLFFSPPPHHSLSPPSSCVKVHLLFSSRSSINFWLGKVSPYVAFSAGIVGTSQLWVWWKAVGLSAGSSLDSLLLPGISRSVEPAIPRRLRQFSLCQAFWEFNTFCRHQVGKKMSFFLSRQWLCFWRLYWLLQPLFLLNFLFHTQNHFLLPMFITETWSGNIRRWSCFPGWKLAWSFSDVSRTSCFKGIGVVAKRKNDENIVYEKLWLNLQGLRDGLGIL